MAVALVLLGIVLALVLCAFVIWPLLLEAACAIYNRVVRGTAPERVVPRPGFGKALVIVLVCGVASSLVTALFAWIGGPASTQLNLSDPSALPVRLALNPIAPIASLLVDAALLSAMLPTRFARAIIVALVDTVLHWVSLVGVLLGAGAALALVLVRH